MSPTVHAPFLKFFNLCYLMNQSTGCGAGPDRGPGGSSQRQPHVGRNTPRAGPRRSLRLSHPAAHRGLFQRSRRLAGLLPPAWGINRHTHETPWLPPVPATRPCPVSVHARALCPAPQLLRVFPVQQRGRLTNPRLERSPAADGELWECWGAGGLHSSARANVPLSFQEKCSEPSPVMKRGGVDFTKSGVSRPRGSGGFGAGLGPRRDTVLYLPCEENYQ